MSTQPLAEPAVTDVERTSSIGLKGEGLRGNGLVLWGVIIMFIGAAIGILGKKFLHMDIVTVVGVLISLVGMFLAVYPYLSPWRPQKYMSGPHSRRDDLTPSQPSKYLPQASNIGYIPSITERTTDLLKNSGATKPRSKEDGNLKPNSESGEKP